MLHYVTCNFVLDEVIDRNQSWGGVYPLGAVYHGQSSFPLTLRSVLDECSLNASSVDALQLKNVMELDLLTIGDVSHALFLSLIFFNTLTLCLSLFPSLFSLPSPLSFLPH